MVKIALFGTSADPPTIGHQAILEWLAQQFDQVAVWAADNPFKQHQTPLVHRQEMLRLLIEPLQAAGQSVALYPELSHSRTLRTVERAYQRWPQAEFTLVVGSDLVPTITHWYRIQELLAQIKLLIVSRPGATLAASDLQQLRQKGADLAIADFTGPAVSSTAYREQGNTEGLTPTIEAYIHQQGLYPCVDRTRNKASKGRMMDAAAKG